MIDTLRWGYVFYTIATNISFEERLGIVATAIKMYYSKEDRKKIKGDSYEGVLSTEGKRGLLGSFAGQVFKAEIETSKGKQDLSFLVTEKINEMLN